jgi:SAM-dependent methyltransferase
MAGDQNHQGGCESSARDGDGMAAPRSASQPRTSRPTVSHQDTYKENEAYAGFLERWDPGFYAKYADTLAAAKPGARVLDVGCGTGQALRRLLDRGAEAHGVDVSAPNIRRARAITERCQLYDGRQLPFADRQFAAAGALNVLEHVEQPEAFIRELVRVVEPGGRVVLSSPNFFRVLGWRDYHPRMRGLGNKWRNLRRLWWKSRQMRMDPANVRFDRMDPIVKEPFSPDDDAIVATNPIEMRFFLERAGCHVERVECTDRYVPRLIDLALNGSPLRHLIFNAFLVARRGTEACAQWSG